MLVSAPLFSAGWIVAGGGSIPGTSPSQGHASFAATGIFWEKALARRFSARLELFPAAVFRERERPVRFGDSRRVDVGASAACLLGRYVIANPASPVSIEAGAGPFYAYGRPVPSGGTRANFFDQIGIAWKRARWEVHVRYTHVSNFGFQGRHLNPGVSFFSGAIGYFFP
jgi:Lipid A 3-O-deacylase (PagL)